MKMTYAQQLKHPNWQRRRLEMLSAANWACAKCGAADLMLHVHHKQYFKGRMAWEYSDEELAVLCEVCHTEHHSSEESIKAILAQAESIPVYPLLAGAFAWAEGQDPDIIVGGYLENGHVFLAGCIAAICAGYLTPEQTVEVASHVTRLFPEKEKISAIWAGMQRLMANRGQSA
ncbi:hypothetical protein CNECB9_2370116 [Cupriavidus necator]|uniref:HNH endonuclease n=1 Tax=Cupriavidus necator TaxID=106590 RepID=A0A1K0IRL1_CUPNE|nr:hypothetical protein CNECB9_2370116 [Cupriavidus necator]